MFSNELIEQIFVGKISVNLSRQEELDLVTAHRQGDESATVRLMQAYAGLLNSSVRRFTQTGNQDQALGDLDDMRSSALVGLLEAVKAFDPAQHERIATIAPRYIAGELSSEATGASHFTVPERSMKRYWSILREANGDVMNALQLAPTMHMDPSTFLSIHSAVRGTSSYSGTEQDGAPEVYHTSVDGVVASTELVIEDAMLVAAAFEAIDGDQTEVVRSYYGFDDYGEPQSDAEVAHRMGLSRPKVQRVRASALNDMRKKLGVA